MSLVKQVIEGVSKPLAYICNLSFHTGSFHLYKTGSKHNFTNYRPVSLLPQFSRVLETAIQPVFQF